MKRHKRLRWFIIISFTLCGVVAATWWGVDQYGEIKSKNNSTMQIAKLNRRDLSSTVLATGAVQPRVGAEVRVGARISGKVERLYANIGDQVNTGQVIAELEKADLKAAVARAQAEVKVAEARIADADARIKLADLEYQRQQNLNKDDFTSQQAVDKALKEKESAAAGRNLATKQLDAVLAALQETQVKLSYATITAPISGVIASVSTQQGETIAAGLNAPTFVTIIDLNRIQVDAFVDETDIGKIKVGQKTIFLVDTYPNKEFSGKVAAIYPKAIIQDNVVNYDVVIDINSSFKDLLRPDMTASVTIYLAVRKGVLMLSRNAIIRENGRKFVLVRSTKNQLQKKTIQTGISSGNAIEIVSGLTEKDTVLIENK